MTERISIEELRYNASTQAGQFSWPPSRLTVLALVEAVEAAQKSMEQDEEDASGYEFGGWSEAAMELKAALARFDFRDEK